MAIFTKKSVQDVFANQISYTSDSNQKLTGIELIIIGVGSMLGSGVFALTGVVAAENAGPAVVLSYVVAGFSSLLAAFLHIEMASKLPTKCGLYDYAYVSLGQGFAWLVFTWCVIELLFGVSYTLSALTTFFLDYIDKCTNIVLPLWIVKNNVPLLGKLFNIASLIVIAPMAFFVCFGVIGGKYIRRFLLFTKIFSVIVFIITTFKYCHLHYLFPFVPKGIGGIFIGSGVLFVCYYGFSTMVVLLNECKNPKKDLIVGSIGSITITGLIYVIISLMILSLGSYYKLNSITAVFDLLRLYKSSIGLMMLYVCTFSGMIFIVLFLLFALVQTVQYVAQDKLFPNFAINRIFLVIFLSLLSCTCTRFISPFVLSQISSLGICMNYFFAAFFVLLFRLRFTKMQGSFRAPFVYIIAPYTILLTLYLVVAQCIKSAQITKVVLITFTVSFIYYFLWSMSKNFTTRNNTLYKDSVL